MALEAQIEPTIRILEFGLLVVLRNLVSKNYNRAVGLGIQVKRTGGVGGNNKKLGPVVFYIMYKYVNTC